MNGLLRQPFAIFGAIAAISMLSDVITLDDRVLSIIDAVRRATHPLWQLVFRFLRLDLPAEAKDYLTMGVIVAGMRLRQAMFGWASVRSGAIAAFHASHVGVIDYRLERADAWKFHAVYLPLTALIALAAWPAVLIIQTMRYFLDGVFRGYQTDPRAAPVLDRSREIFFETAFWLLFVILLNYALLLKG